MNEYETTVIITSILRYKKNDNIGVKVDFLLTDPSLCNNTDNFIGCVSLTQWYQGDEVFEKLKGADLILKPAQAHFKCVADYKDPLKTVSRMDSVKTKDHDISLLQSK